MTQEQLRECVQLQQPPLPMGFEARHDALLDSLTKREVAMKRKVSYSVVFVLALLLVAIGIAVAAELGVFGQMGTDWFGKKMEHLEQVAEVYTQQTEVPGDENGFPAIAFSLTQAHFDGETLYAAYRLTPGAYRAVFHNPADASDIAWDVTPGDGHSIDGLESMLSAEDYAFMQKTLREKGEVFMTICEQCLGDGVYLPDGEYVSPDEGEESLTDAGDRIGYKRLRLPNAADQDSVEVAFPLMRIVLTYYQNADGAYFTGKRLADQLLKATVRQNAEVVEPTVYSTTFWGHEAQVKVLVSDIDIRVQVGLKLTPEDKRKWENQWDDTTLDALESFRLYADGTEVRVRATECDTDETYPLIMNMEYELPDSLTTLKLIPSYSLSGEHEDEAFILK